MTNSKREKFFFSADEEASIVKAIQSAETNTSGEIRIRVEGTSGKDVYKRAVEVFEKLGMQKTELRNGILFYLSTEDKQFALIGDQGIHQKVSDDFWSTVKDEVIQEFSKGNFTEGLCNGIIKCGNALAEYFPYQSDDVNELPDEISKGEL